MTILRLAFRQIQRNPFRTVLMIAGVATAAAATTAVTLLVAGTNRGLQRTVGRLGADLMVVPRGEEIAGRFSEALLTGKPAMFYLSPDAVRAVSDVPGVRRASAQTFVETLDSARCCAGKFFVVGFDPETDFTITPWLSREERPPPNGPERDMIVGDRILLRKGDTASFFGTTFTVAGVLDPTGMGMDWTVYVPEHHLNAMIAGSKDSAERALHIAPGSASAVFVKVAPGADVIDVAEHIERARPDVQAVLASTVAHAAGQQLRGIGAALVCVVVALWLTALILIAVVSSQSVREQQTDVGLLMAKGADRRFVLRFVTAQSACMTVLAASGGCILGACAVVLSHGALSRALGVMAVLPSSAGILGLSLVLVILAVASAMAAAMAPALRVLRMDAYEAVQQGAAA